MSFVARCGSLATFGAYLLICALTFAADDLFGLWGEYAVGMRIWSIALIIATIVIAACMLINFRRGPSIMGGSQRKSAFEIGLPLSAAAISFAMAMSIWAAPILGALMWGGAALCLRGLCGTRGAAMVGGGAFVGACAIGMLRMLIEHG